MLPSPTCYARSRTATLRWARLHTTRSGRQAGENAKSERATAVQPKDEVRWAEQSCSICNMLTRPCQSHRGTIKRARLTQAQSKRALHTAPATQPRPSCTQTCRPATTKRLALRVVMKCGCRDPNTAPRRGSPPQTNCRAKHTTISTPVVSIDDVGGMRHAARTLVMLPMQQATRTP